MEVNHSAESRAITTPRSAPRRSAGGASSVCRLLMMMLVGIGVLLVVPPRETRPSEASDPHSVAAAIVFFNLIQSASREGEAPAEPEHTSQPQLASRLRGSVALPSLAHLGKAGRPASVATAGPPKDRTSAIDEHDETERRRNVASILMMMLVGVGLIGVAMIAAALMWGAKLRRLARESVPGPTQRDELWYLKTPPPPEDGGASHAPSLTGNQPTLPTIDGRPTTDRDTKT